MNLRMDPVLFADRWASTAPVDVPVKGQASYARQALQFHADLLYTNPLSKDLKARERDRYVRLQLRMYSASLDSKGFMQTTLEYKDIAHLFLESLSQSDGKLFYELHPSIMDTPMKWCAVTLIGRDLANETDVSTIQFIYEWLTYLSKLPLRRPDLRKPAETAWIERQVNPKAITASYEVITEVRRIVGCLFEPKFEFVGNHGPGSTADGDKTVPEKNQNYRPTIQSNQLTRFHVDNISYGFHLIREAVWKAVFKDVGSLRPITMEPVEAQFAQQGLKYDIYRQVDAKDSVQLVSRFIRFSDQQPSRDAAVIGSRLIGDRFKPSTIDLKSASDRLSLDLIINLFTGNFLHYILCGRSWKCRVGKKRLIELAMYAGMGSALTFPIQSIVFCALAIYATLKELYKMEYGVEGTIDDLFETYFNGDELRDGYRDKYRRVWKSIRIYGDDISLPDFAAERLIMLLSDFGLEVNTRKSFTGRSPVRESCGVYAVAGYVFTPQRLRIPDSGWVMDGAQYEALRMAINEAFLSGKRVLYRSLIRFMKSREIFISSKELSRKHQRSKLYPGEKQILGNPDFLFEQASGQLDANEPIVGFLSSRGSSPTHTVQIHEKLGARTTYFVESVSTRDTESEYYHLTVNYRQMAFPEQGSMEDHGSVPAGTRLKLRNASLSVSSRRGSFMDWGWAPS